MSYESIDESYEFIRNHLPKYLTPELKDNLFKLVKENFPNTNNNLIYCDDLDSEIYYQGDLLIDIPFSYFNKGEFNTTYSKGVIISNTCDISTENERLVKPIIQLAKIYELEDLIEQFKQDGHKQSKIEIFITNLKENRLSNLFYLPKKIKNGNVLINESYIRFDENISLPIEIFESEVYNKKYYPDGDRIFSFSNYGFYTFLIKLSVHYCRFREGVFRSA